MINSFRYLDSFIKTPDFYSALKNPLADLNKMMMYVWAKNLSLKYTLENNILYNVATFQGIPFLWGPPLGKEVHISHIFKGIKIIQNQRNKKGIKTKEPEILYLWKDYELFRQIVLNNNFQVSKQAKEYIYNSFNLASLKQPELKSKRKSKNRFIKKFKPEIKFYSRDDRISCIELIDKWEFQKQPRISKENENKFLSELSVCRNAFTQDLPFEGVTAFLEGRIIAFSVGYKHTRDTFNCMFEKTDLYYPDASSYIFSELGNMLKNKYQYINAGEDWGVDYLAIAKKKWRPIKTEQSFSLKMIQ